MLVEGRRSVGEVVVRRLAIERVDVGREGDPGGARCASARATRLRKGEDTPNEEEPLGVLAVHLLRGLYGLDAELRLAGGGHFVGGGELRKRDAAIVLLLDGIHGQGCTSGARREADPMANPLYTL